MPIDKRPILKAVDEVKKGSKKRKFNQSVNLIVNLKDIDLKRPENRINELIELPHASKADAKIVVLASGDLALRAERAKATAVMSRADVEHFTNDKKGAKKLVEDTDFFLAETPMMATVGKVLGPILGPRGKMPTPVPPTASIETIIDRHRRSLRVRLREQPTAQLRIGSEDMSNEELADNIQAVVNLFERKLAKGSRNISRIYVKTTMGHPTRVEF